jgi:cysteine desulfurase / selenocysteine lyase
MISKLLYLNNSATSYPKPQSVIDAVNSAITLPPQEYGRTSSGINTIESTRAVLSELFGLKDKKKIVLLPSATYALNLCVSGLVKENIHVITSCYEHNSLLRPLYFAQKYNGVELSILSIDECRPENILTSLKKVKRKNTKVIALTQMSNVTGMIFPVEEIARFAANNNLSFIIDGAQGGGVSQITYENLEGKNYYCFAGHKNLFGPSGIGGLIVPDDTLPQNVYGGTGILSSHKEHPPQLPLRHEAGTPNLSGLMGLKEGVSFVLDKKIAKMGIHKKTLVANLIKHLKSIGKIKILENHSEDYSGGIVSFCIEGVSSKDVGFILSQTFSIETRTGLHCAPLVNDEFSFPKNGSIRVSFGPSNTLDDVEYLKKSISMLLTMF